VNSSERRAFAAALHAAGRAHDERQPDRLARWRNVEPETAELLGVLVRAKRAQRVLEIGTSNGYSTIWLADAAESTGGTVVTVEIEPSRTALARENLARAGLEDRVEVRTEDAAQTLRDLPDGAFELTFLDGERAHYVGYWRDVVRTLAPGGLLAVDNAISHANELVDFRAVVDADARVTQALVPIGAGLLLAVTPG
jgi:predicted O-methyltransferase YrrM